MSAGMKSWIAGVVTFVWAATALSTVYTGNFVALGSVTPVMMIVAGFLFGYRVELKKPSGNGSEEPPGIPRPRSSDLSDW